MDMMQEMMTYVLVHVIINAFEDDMTIGQTAADDSSEDEPEDRFRSVVGTYLPSRALGVMELLMELSTSRAPRCCVARWDMSLIPPER